MPKIRRWCRRNQEDITGLFHKLFTFTEEIRGEFSAFIQHRVLMFFTKIRNEKEGSYDFC